MKEVLINPIGGYYMSKDVFGHQGDFITSPEIGQVFGEMIAIWFVTEWQKLGSPTPLQIVELGPGRGTLMQDIIRVFAKFKLSDNTSIHFVEVSDFLSRMQAQKLCIKHKEVSDLLYYREGETASGIKVFWYRSINNLPNNFTILLAHEFFDALPVHKLFKEGEQWKEILIDIEPNDDKRFRFIKSRVQTPVSKLFHLVIHPEENRDLVEFSVEADTTIKTLSKLIEEHGGIGLVIDYGHTGEKGDTFRAFKNHALYDPLLNPGSADLTADVDFRQLKYSCETEGKLITFGPIEQGKFIQNMGGEVRLRVLLEKATEEEAKDLKSGYELLTSGQKMGSRFKLLSFFPAVVKDHLLKFPVSGFH